MQAAIRDVLEEVERQDELHPDGYPATRDGIRHGLACMQDELVESLMAWHKEKRLPERRFQHTRAELKQCVAIGLRMLREIPIEILER